MIEESQTTVTFTPVDPGVFLYAAGAAALIVFAAAALLILTRYKRCPSNRILVVFGKVGHGRSSKCLRGGGTFVMPLIQDYAYLSLEPMRIDLERLRIRSLDGAQLDFNGAFTVAIGREPAQMDVAAERLLNLPVESIREQARDMILSQLQQTIAAKTADEIDDREKFMKLVNQTVPPGLAGLGLEVLNINIRSLNRQPT